LKRLEANRRNAQLSTGPKTQSGKSLSRRNALKHGILTAALLIKRGESGEDRAEFEELLKDLQENLQPVGTLEEMLVEDIAVARWRRLRALRWEAAEAITDDRVLEEGSTLMFTNYLDRVLRYETSIQRQYGYAINQLERLQRARKGEHLPAPVSVQLSGDQ
jgi:hypothetical protein